MKNFKELTSKDLNELSEEYSKTCPPSLKDLETYYNAKAAINKTPQFDSKSGSKSLILG